MVRIVKVFIGIALVGVIGFVALSFMTGNSAIENALGEAKNNAANAAIDASGIKGTIQDALDANAESIASALGVSVQDARNMIADLDIQSWSAITLPSDAQAAESFDASLGGTSAEVTLYDDPSYVTVEAYGQSVTLSVPDSARDYLGYLSYLPQ